MGRTAGPPAPPALHLPHPRLDRVPDPGLGLTPRLPHPGSQPQRSPQPARHRVGGRGPRPLRGRRTPSTPSSLEEGLPPTEPKVGRGCLTQKPLAYKHPQLTAPPQNQTGQARPQAPLLAASPGKARGPGEAPLADAPRGPARPVDPGGAPRRAATWGNRGPGTRRPSLQRRAGAGSERGRGAHLLFSQPRSWPSVRWSLRPRVRLPVCRCLARKEGGARGGAGAGRGEEPERQVSHLARAGPRQGRGHANAPPHEPPGQCPHHTRPTCANPARRAGPPVGARAGPRARPSQRGAQEGAP